MKALMVVSMIVVLLSGCRNSIEGTSIEHIQKTGKLWGIRGLRTNADGSVTLFDAQWSGYGYGLSMLDANRKRSDLVTLKAKEVCYLSDFRHATISYQFLGVEDGALSFKVTDHFDARSFGEGVKEVTRTVTVSEYSDEDKKPQSTDAPDKK